MATTSQIAGNRAKWGLEVGFDPIWISRAKMLYFLRFCIFLWFWALWDYKVQLFLRHCGKSRWGFSKNFSEIFFFFITFFLFCFFWRLNAHTVTPTRVVSSTYFEFGSHYRFNLEVDGIHFIKFSKKAQNIHWFEKKNSSIFVTLVGNFKTFSEIDFITELIYMSIVFIS